MKTEKIQYTATGAAGIILVLVLAVMLNWISGQRWIRKDVTSSQMYTVSERTENLLSELSDPVQVIVFMTPASALYEHVRELLNQYATISPLISVEYIDPDREPMRTRTLIETYAVSAADTVVFVADERSKYVTSDQLAEYDYSGMQMGRPATMKAFKGEEAFTSAILSLVAPKVPKIYFVTGHGEASVTSSTSAEQAGLQELNEALKRENMETAEVMLLSGQVPEDADALVIAGPTQPYTEAEVELIDQYIAEGGRLLVCLDPLIRGGGAMKQTRLENLLLEQGIAVGNDLVVDPSRKLPFYDLSAVYLDGFRPHPMTKGLEGVAVLFPYTRSMTVTEAENTDAQTLIETTEEGWGETDLAGLLTGTPIGQDDNDLPGPVSVAAVVEHSEDNGGGRIIAVGDSDFMSDTQIMNAGNLTLTLNMFNWLAARDNAMGIPPRQVEQVSLYLSGQQLSMILLLVMIIMPCAVIVAGIIVWRRRRR